MSLETPNRFRVLRKRASVHEEGGEGSWAVSYADFLMVLLSFFIVFFNLEDKSGNTSHYLEMVENLAKSPLFRWVGDSAEGDLEILQNRTLKKILSHKELAESKMSADGGPHFYYRPFELALFPPSLTPRSWEAISTWQAQKNLGLSFDFSVKGEEGPVAPISGIGTQEGILIQLPDDIYGKGGHEVNANIASNLSQVVELVKKNFDTKKIQIMVIGHSDQSPIQRLKGTVSSNIGLSSLRAIGAAEYLLKHGLNKNQVLIQGTSDLERNTRSISLKVVLLD